MMYTDDTRLASLNITRHHDLWVWEQRWEMGGGKLERLIAFRVYKPWTIKNKI